MNKSINLNKIACSNCGAELLFDPGTKMSNCNFCGSQFEIENTEEDKVIVPDEILPFSVVKNEYNKKVLEWLSEGDYTPDDILEGSHFSSVNGLYLPMFFFTGKYSGNWSASSGYNRTEYYTEYSESQKKRVQRSRTVTDWRPSSGSFAGQYAILSYAGNGETIDESIATYAHGTSYNRGEVKPFDIKYTQGFNLLSYDKDEFDTWSIYGINQLTKITNLDAKKRVPGDKHKDLYCDVIKSDDKFTRVYVPFWITYYKYKNSKFHVHMDGTSTLRINGVRPVDQARKDEANKLYYKGHFGCVTTIITYIIAAYGVGSTDPNYDTWVQVAGIFTLGTLVLYGIGKYQKNKMISESKARRQEILKNKLNPSAEASKRTNQIEVAPNEKLSNKKKKPSF